MSRFRWSSSALLSLSKGLSGVSRFRWSSLSRPTKRPQTHSSDDGTKATSRLNLPHPHPHITLQWKMSAITRPTVHLQPLLLPTRVPKKFSTNRRNLRTMSVQSGKIGAWTTPPPSPPAVGCDRRTTREPAGPARARRPVRGRPAGCAGARPSGPAAGWTPCGC